MGLNPIGLKSHPYTFSDFELVKNQQLDAA